MQQLGKFHSNKKLWCKRSYGAKDYRERTINYVIGGSFGAVVRALAFHQYGPGWIPRSDVICGLSLLVLYSAPRRFSRGTPVFPSHQKPTFDLI